MIADVANPEQHLIAWALHGMGVKVPLHWGQAKVPNPLLASWPQAQPLVAGTVWPPGDPAVLMAHGYQNTAPGASKNWPKLSILARLVNTILTAPSAPEPITLGTMASTDALNWFMIEKTAMGWMGDELLARVYGLFGHIIPTLGAAVFGNAQLQSIADEWLSIMGRFMALTWDDATLRCGWYDLRSYEPGQQSRSATNPIDDFAGWWIGRLSWSTSLSSTTGLMLRGIGRARATIVRNRVWAKYGGPEYRGSFTKLTSAVWHVADKCHVLYNAQGQWLQYCEGLTHNANTPSAPMCSNGNGNGQFLLAPDASQWTNHIRNHNDEAICKRTGDTVTYSSNLPVKPVTLPVPPNSQEWIVGT